jgi:hypothetical protein
MEYEEIPVAITPLEERRFDFDLMENQSFNYYRITCDGKVLYIDENFDYIEGDMPVEWRNPAIARLQTLIKAREHPDGP